MKFKWNDDDQKYLKLGITAFLVVVFSILANQVLHQLPLLTVGLKKFLSCVRPVVYGLVFAYILNPLLNLVERLICTVVKKKNSRIRRHVRGAGVIIVWGLTILLLAVLVKMVVPELISSVQGVITNMPGYVNKLTAWVSQILKDNPEIRTRLITQIRSIYSNFNSIIDGLSGIIPDISELVGGLSSSVFNAVSAVFQFVVGIIVSIYVMTSKEKFSAQAKKLLYSLFPINRVNSIMELVRSADEKFGGFFIGKIIDSIIIGILCFILLSIFKIPYAVLVGCIVGITNIIPFFGPFIGAIPSALLILLASPVKCLYFIIIIIVLQQFDGNILGPKILSTSIGLSSFWVMFSILVFGGMFGFWGLLCSVPLFAVIYDLVSVHVNRKLKSKNLPTSTLEYETINKIEEDDEIAKTNKE